MALETLRLSQTTDSYEYDITMIQEVGGRQTKEAFSIAQPGRAPNQNIMLGVSGMQAELPVTFKVHDDGTDKANGTAAGEGFADDTVVTINEQLGWLHDYIHAPEFSVAWTLDHVTGDRFDDDAVFVEAVEAPYLVRSSPKWVEATIRLRRGQSI